MHHVLALLQLLIPAAAAVSLENAGTWSAGGAPNVGVMSMWATICSTLPFCGVGANAPGFFAAKVINFVFSVISILSIMLIIYAGIRMIASQGDDAAYTDAKKIVIYALVGLALGIAGSTIMTYFVNSLLLPAIS